MSDAEDLLELERAAWRALTDSGAAATAHYDEVLAPDVLMLLPGGMVIDDRAQVVASMGGAPWQSHELSDERVVPLGTDAAVVAYRATAVRDDTPYTALFASTYVRHDGSWRLAIHQQTPA